MPAKSFARTAAPAADLAQQNVVAAIDGLDDAHGLLTKHKATVARAVEELHRNLDDERTRHRESIEAAQRALAASEERSAAAYAKLENAKREAEARSAAETARLKRNLQTAIDKLKAIGRETGAGMTAIDSMQSELHQG